MLTTVPQISGRGQASKPYDNQPVIINNVVKPFQATSEEDRRRATLVLDYIIKKKKFVEKKKAEDIKKVEH